MIFPNLTDVRGAFTIISSKDSILDKCGKLQSLSGSGSVIKGKLVCKGACTDIEDDTTCQSLYSSGSDTDPSKGKNSTKIGVSIGVGLGGALLLAVVGALLYLRHRRRMLVEITLSDSMERLKSTSDLYAMEIPDYRSHGELGGKSMNEIAMPQEAHKM